MNKLTINQLLDKINELKLDDMNQHIGTIRQNLINMKREHPKGGLRRIENSEHILELIQSAKVDHSTAETAKLY